MSETRLPTTAELRTRMVGLDCVVSTPALVVLVVYLYVLLRPSVEEWQAFAAIAAVYGVLSFLVYHPFRHRMLAPLESALAARAAGDSSADWRAAFRTVMAMPRRMVVASFALWLLAAPFISLGLVLFGFSGWAEGIHLFVVVLAAATGGFASSAMIYGASRRLFAPIRECAAAALPDAAERQALITPIPLARKLLMGVVGCGVATLVFTMALAYVRAGASIDGMVLDWQARALAQLAPRLADRSLEQATSELFPDPTLLPYAARFEIREAAAAPARASDDGIETLRALPDGRALAVSVEREALGHSLDDLRNQLAMVLVAAVALLAVVARALASDAGRVVSQLRSEAERLARGDLRTGRVFESDDELGDLARVFERMSASLGSLVERVAQAADRVEETAGDITRVSDSVDDASTDQVKRIEEVGELMSRIHSQVGGVADSAQNLNGAVEDSSSSILELGAAGDELNDTASVLSSKVDEVSTSIEEMVRSVKQVSASSESLVDAAAETSASMEQMASAMRSVDTTAAKTAELSRAVVSRAERGREKVSETIDGMEAIRQATEAAESVIRGLGARTREIGAILDVIDDVADETNLLALNAAIIAAQAGEHGRSFSVVADQIKQLADRVLASTKEIGGLVHSVQEESANAIGAIEEGSRSVASGVERSAEAGLSLEEITRSSRESGTHIAEIVSALREQTKAAAHVVELMDRVRTGVEQIRAAGSEQDRGNEIVFRSSITMREVAQQVRRTTEEQTRGFARIRESVEDVRDTVEHINGSLQEQSATCGRVAEFLAELVERARSNQGSAQHMTHSVRELLQQAQLLREDVSKFRI